MAKLRRFLSDWRIYAAIGYLALALGIGLQTRHATSQERDLLIDFVCDSIAVRLEQDGPDAAHFAAHFAVIMREHDARCSPPVKGLP
jgi:hypothetical protein